MQRPSIHSNMNYIASTYDHRILESQRYLSAQPEPLMLGGGPFPETGYSLWESSMAWSASLLLIAF